MFNDPKQLILEKKSKQLALEDADYAIIITSNSYLLVSEKLSE